MVDEEMQSQQTQGSDSTQFTTQSRKSASTQASYTVPNEIWGKLLYQKLKPRSLGIRRGRRTYDFDGESKPFVLAGPTFGVGRLQEKNHLSCTSLGLDEKKYDHFSSCHFKLSKDQNDVLSPVILEDLSRNGTFVRVGAIEHKVENKRILLHDDVIVVHAIPAEFTFISCRIPTKDLPVEITQRYHIGQKLGKGAFGVVYSVHDVLSCERYALKFVKKKPKETEELQLSTSSSKPSLPDTGLMERVRNEAELLRILKHPFIIQIHGKPLCSEDGSIGMLLDIMLGGDLHSRIIGDIGYLSEENAKFFFYQICVGVKYLHGQRVTHRDIKPENILLASTEVKSQIKITDFGLSKQIHSDSELRTKCGTLAFLAPEIKRSNGSIAYTNKADIWSLGILLIFALTGVFPDENDDNKTFQPHPRNRVTTNAKKLIKKMLTVDEKYRPSVDDLLNDVWMQDEKIIDDVKTLLQTPMTAHIRSESPMTSHKSLLK